MKHTTLANATLEDRLDNWSRAHRWYGNVGRCFSLEGNYRSPRGVEVEYESGDPPPKPPQMIDILDAWDVEVAWRSISLKGRWVIKYSVHDRSDRHWQGRCMCARLTRNKTAANVRPADWRDHVRSAKQEVRDALAVMLYAPDIIISKGDRNLLQVLEMFGITHSIKTIPASYYFAEGAA